MLMGTMTFQLGPFMLLPSPNISIIPVAEYRVQGIDDPFLEGVLSFLGKFKGGVIVFILSIVGFIIGDERLEMLVVVEVLDRMLGERDAIVQQLNGIFLEAPCMNDKLHDEGPKDRNIPFHDHFMKFHSIECA